MTNVDAFASGRPERVLNLMPDDAGTLVSRPGLLAFADVAGGLPGAAGATSERVIGLCAHGDHVIAVTEHRRFVAIDEAGSISDVTDAHLGGWRYPTFLRDDDGQTLVFGGGRPGRIGQSLRATAFGVGLDASPTHGAIVDRVLLVNDDGSDFVKFSAVAAHSEFAYAPPAVYPGQLRAGTRADGVTALCAFQNRLMLFGPESIECFYGTGTIAPPFRLEDDSIQSELSAPYSLTEAGGTMWWLDSRGRLVRLEGRQTRPMSGAVERQVSALAVTGDCAAHEVLFDGRRLLVLHFEAASKTMVYDYARDAWSEWCTHSAANGDEAGMPMLAYCYQPRWGRHFCAGTDTVVYELSSGTYTDDGSPLVRSWTGPYYDGGTFDLKFARRAQVLLDGGTATSHTSSSDAYNPTVEVRWRNEDRQWQAWRQMQTGRIGSRDSVRDVWMRSVFRRQQLQWRSSAPVALRLNRIEIEAEGRTR